MKKKYLLFWSLVAVFVILFSFQTPPTQSVACSLTSASVSPSSGNIGDTVSISWYTQACDHVDINLGGYVASNVQSPYNWTLSGPPEQYTISAYGYCNNPIAGPYGDETYLCGQRTVSVSGPSSYQVSCSTNAGGSCTPTPQTITSGSTTTVTATPSTGYAVTGISGCGGSAYSGSSTTAVTYTTGAISSNCTVGVSFILTEVPVVNGKCSVPAAHYTCFPGTSVNNVSGATAWTWDCLGSGPGHTDAIGCSESKPVMSGSLSASSSSCVIPLGGDSCNVSLTWSTTNPQATSAVTSNYPSANTTVFSGNNGGPSSVLIPYSSRAFYLYNNSVPLDQTTVSASCGSNVWSNGSCQSPTVSYIVSGSAGAGGTISPASQSVNSGSSTTLTVTPSAGYSIASATGCFGGWLSGNTFTTGSITGPCTVSATFSQNPIAPTVTTKAVSNITANSADSGGTIISNGNSVITVSGIVWSTSVNPTTALPTKTTDGWQSGGPWSSTMASLSGNTTYHVRAYATNAVGTSYGSDLQFTTPATPVVINGACASPQIHYGCASGTSINNVNGALAYTWTCQGSGGGSNASCSEPKSAPNLVANIPTTPPIIATVNVPVTLSTDIFNIGNATTGAGFSYFFQKSTDSNGLNPIDITPFGTTTSISAGFDRIVSIDHSFTSTGTYYIRACADKSSSLDGEVITESNEGDNCSYPWVSVTVNPPPTGAWSAWSACVNGVKTSTCPAGYVCPGDDGSHTRTLTCRAPKYKEN